MRAGGEVRRAEESAAAAGCHGFNIDDEVEAGSSTSPRIHAFFETLIHPVSGRYLSEDFAFCHRWRSTGGDVWVDVQTPLGHEGSFMFEGRPDQVSAALGRQR